MPGLLLYSSDISITPPTALPLGGYTARNGSKFEQGGQDLIARTRILGDIVLVSVEMLTVPESLIEAVRERLPRNLKIVLMATHTHCAPDSQMLNKRMTFPIPGIATYSKRWLNWYADEITEGILAAKNNSPKNIQKIFLTKAQVPQVRSRRSGPVDPVASQITVQGKDFSEIFLTIYGAHPTLLDETVKTLQGDWPGEILRQSKGLVATGLIGNASPIPTPGYPMMEQPNKFAENILKNLKNNKPKQIWTEGFPIPYLSTMVTMLPKPVPHQTFAQVYGVTPELATNLVNKFAAPTIEINTIQIGSLTLRTISGEPTCEFGKKIGGKSDLFISHANGWVGYMLTAEDYNRGGYEATLAFNGPNLLQELIQPIGR